MEIESILAKDCTRARMPAGSKKKILENLAQLFADHIENINADELFTSLINRERLGSTGIGQGIAIPHCRFNTGGKSYCACITLEEPVDFDAVDNKPVDIVFAMVVPQDAESNHLETLAQLAERMQQPEFVARLRRARTDEQLFEYAKAS